MECLETHLRRGFVLESSALSDLWDDCPRCFWLRVRRGILPPRRSNAVLMKYRRMAAACFAGAPMSALDPMLPPGRCLASGVRVRSKRLLLPGCDDACVLRGRVPHLLRFEDGGWGILDFTLADPGLIRLSGVSRRLHTLARALEVPAPGGLELTPIVRMGVVCLDPVAVRGDIRSRRLFMQLDMHWIEIRRDDAAFERFLGEALRLLARPDPPPGAEGCSYCKYHAARVETDPLYRHDGLPF